MQTSVLAVRFNKQHRKADFIRERVRKVPALSLSITTLFHDTELSRKVLQDSIKGVE